MEKLIINSISIEAESISDIEFIEIHIKRKSKREIVARTTVKAEKPKKEKKEVPPKSDKPSAGGNVFGQEY